MDVGIDISREKCQLCQIVDRHFGSNSVEWPIIRIGSSIAYVDESHVDGISIGSGWFDKGTSALLSGCCAYTAGKSDELSPPG